MSAGCRSHGRRAMGTAASYGRLGGREDREGDTAQARRIAQAGPGRPQPGDQHRPRPAGHLRAALLPGRVAARRDGPDHALVPGRRRRQRPHHARLRLADHGRGRLGLPAPDRAVRGRGGRRGRGRLGDPGQARHHAERPEPALLGAQPDRRRQAPAGTPLPGEHRQGPHQGLRHRGHRLRDPQGLDPRPDEPHGRGPGPDHRGRERADHADRLLDRGRLRLHRDRRPRSTSAGSTSATCA